MSEVEKADNIKEALTVVERYFTVFYVTSNIDTLEKFYKNLE